MERLGVPHAKFDIAKVNEECPKGLCLALSERFLLHLHPDEFTKMELQCDREQKSRYPNRKVRSSRTSTGLWDY